ncbi:MAG: SIS domain-containing protein [Verrucomicrobia bacterium]|nr:SIS domain-containing protein [Verrucomicrobiota bacterium]
MKLPDQFLQKTLRQLQEMARTQRPAIEQAAEWFADCLEQEGWIYLFGTGHSHMLAEELFYRAGGLARIAPILCEPLMLHESAADSSLRERDPRLAAELLARYPIGARDLLVVVSNSGRNAAPIELARLARARGARVIALTNRKQCARWPSRHPQGLKLPDTADLTLDNCGEEGDACVPVERLGTAIGPTSTIVGATLLQMIVCGAVEKTLERGGRPEVFVSSNTTGDEANAPILARYRGRIRHL